MRVTGSTKLNKTPFIIGLAGGSGSGKTFFASALKAKLGSDICEIVLQDNFYFDQSQKFDGDGGSVNFDHPDSIDFKLLAQNLRELKNGNAVDIPIYDFPTHSRKKETLTIQPKSVILVDGILIFHAVEVRGLFDDLIFFDTPEQVRYQRRLHRDIHERGRTAEGVKAQFLKQVKPMHDTFVEPSKIHAKTLVTDDLIFKKLMDLYCQIHA
jgi:uridine kinase